MNKDQTLALLMFNYNENEGIIRNIELLSDVVDEVLIVDSSDLEKYEKLYQRYRNAQKVSIIRVFPIGYADPFRMYALKKIRSDWVLCLDGDEEPNGRLISDLKTIEFQNISAYNILRFEETYKCYDHQLRLYRKDSVFFRGMIHEFPVVKGIVKYINEQDFIIHHADFSNYLRKRGSYLTLEAYERPFTPFYLSTQSSIFNMFSDKHKILGKYSIILFSFILFIRRSFNANSIKYRRYRFDWFLFKYTLNRYKYFIKLPKRNKLVKINEDIVRSGGVIKYLNLDDIDYVENLTKTFRFDKNGITIFEELVNYKYCNQKFKNEI